MTDIPTLGPRWLGMNHLALVTSDMDATVRFWHEVLGAEIVATVATPDFKHYFFRIGEAQMEMKPLLQRRRGLLPLRGGSATIPALARARSHPKVAA